MAENTIAKEKTPHRRSSSPTKRYQMMLLKDVPDGNLTEPQHAVLESVLEEGDGTQNVRNHALIHYLATLASSNKTNDSFDFEFVESLIKNGADINSADKTGQTIFHEVARSWDLEVALFLIKNGANTNQQDQFGRSPLHVAAAVDYPEMLEFLLQNGADLDIKTNGEQQTPLHFAAKNDAVNSVQMLLGYGADIDARDAKNRTPLQVSAEMNRSKAARCLVNAGAPAGVYDNSGNSALSFLIEKIPEVALDALDQFHSVDVINRKEYYFLNYVEGAKLQGKKTKARTPLDIAVQNERFDVVMHPVMQRLISLKWKAYGKWGAIQSLVLNLLYAIVWSVEGIKITRRGRDMYFPLDATHVPRFLGAIFIVLFTLVEIQRQVTNTIKGQREFKKWQEWRAKQLEADLQYCHPRWPQEIQYLQSEIKAVRNMSFITNSDWWIYFDWVTLLFTLLTITTHVMFVVYDTDEMKELHQHTMIPLLMVLWFRIFKYARPFESAGPYIVILGSVMGDILKWGLLNSVIIIPYACAFWITFGAVSLHPVPDYDTPGPLLYNVFSMMVVGDHNFDALEEANPILARLLCGSFIGIVAIVTLNLLIALLSNTFERLYENAVANAVMQRARTILMLQRSLRKKRKERYYNLIRKIASPEIIQNKFGRTCTSADEHVTMDRVLEGVQTINTILGERFGKRFGKGRKSDMDYVKEDLNNVKILEEQLVRDVKDMKMILQNIGQRLSAHAADGNNTRKYNNGYGRHEDDDHENDNHNHRSNNNNDIDNHHHHHNSDHHQNEDDDASCSNIPSNQTDATNLRSQSLPTVVPYPHSTHSEQEDELSNVEHKRSIQGQSFDRGSETEETHNIDYHPRRSSEVIYDKRKPGSMVFLVPDRLDDHHAKSGNHRSPRITSKAISRFPKETSRSFDDGFHDPGGYERAAEPFPGQVMDHRYNPAYRRKISPSQQRFGQYGGLPSGANEGIYFPQSIPSATQYIQGSSVYHPRSLGVTQYPAQQSFQRRPDYNDWNPAFARAPNEFPGNSQRFRKIGQPGPATEMFDVRGFGHKRVGADVNQHRGPASVYELDDFRWQSGGKRRFPDGATQPSGNMAFGPPMGAETFHEIAEAENFSPPYEHQNTGWQQVDPMNVNPAVPENYALGPWQSMFVQAPSQTGRNAPVKDRKPNQTGGRKGGEDFAPVFKRKLAYFESKIGKVMGKGEKDEKPDQATDETSEQRLLAEEKNDD